MKKYIALGFILAITLAIYLYTRPGPPIRMAEQVNLDLFMGDWYVIANIPTFIEKGAHNAVESYRRKSDTEIATTFSFNQDSFSGPQKTYHPTGFVDLAKPSNAEWGMQFLWPFKSEFIIVYVDPAYEYTIIGRTKRDYLWIMARKPQIDPRELEKLIQIAVDEGYRSSDILMVPQQVK